MSAGGVTKSFFGGSEVEVTGITKPTDNDVICGRGGAALRHPGNMAYRKIVNLNKGLYATCLKAEKLRISKSIVAAIREVKGRFLEREDGGISTTLEETDANGNPFKWRDIGDRRAIEKTSQALREGQPKLLKKLAEMTGNTGGDISGASLKMSIGQHIRGVPHVALHPMHQKASNANILHVNDQIGPTHGRGPPPQHATMPHRPVTSHVPPPVLSTSQITPMNAFSNDQPNNVLANQSYFLEMFGQSSRESSMYSQKDDGFPPLREDSIDLFPRDSQRSNRNIDIASPQAPRANLVNNVNQNQRSMTSCNDSWGVEPTPLPYNRGPDLNEAHTFSTHNQQYLMSCLSVDSKYNDAASHSSGGSLTSGSQTDGVKTDNRRQSVKFDFKQRHSASQAKSGANGFGDSFFSITSHFSELSFCDTQSLDSAMDLAEREEELALLGEFEGVYNFFENQNEMPGDNQNKPGNEHADYKGSPPLGPENSAIAAPTTPLQGPDDHIRKGRRSILRSSQKWSHHAFPPASVSMGADPGMIFTSTFDAKPGGINSGTDVSGLLGQRRKSVVAFEVAVDRRRSSGRMSLCSVLTDASGRFMRDVGSIHSIQSSHIRELISMHDDDDDEDDDDSNV